MKIELALQLTGSSAVGFFQLGFFMHVAVVFVFGQQYCAMCLRKILSHLVWILNNTPSLVFSLRKN